MLKPLLFLWVFVCAFSAFGQRPLVERRSASSLQNTTLSLPIKRVILYSNGVAYIERRGFINGNAHVDLTFKQSQVDDVLKSMLVLDLGKGAIGAVSYNSSAPASARTAEIPFNVTAESEETEAEPAGMAGVLAQLQGAKVLITSSRGTSSGAILTVERKKLSLEKDKEKVPQTAYSVVIASENGDISSFDLADIRTVKLLENDARKDVNQFADATASTRRRDAKTITISSNGVGQREIVVSYTIAAPIWKTTYRVVLDATGKPFFQGWAIVDNVSDEDWSDVKMSLVSGSPISFIQNLQKPLYRYRPIVPIPDDLKLDPQIYDPDISTGEGNGTARGYGGGLGTGNGSGGASAVVTVTADQSVVQTSLSDLLKTENSGVSTAATGAELGDLFEYNIDNAVSVPHDRSALIPIVQTEMQGERVSIYDESAKPDRPMSGMLLVNTTPLTFEGGSMTVLDRDAYAGEALMERLKPQEKRLISFAVDLGTRVSVETKGDNRPAKVVKVVDGTLQVHYFRAETKTYRLANQTPTEKIVYVQHPIRKDWALSEDTPRPESATETSYRFRVVLKPFESTQLVVTDQQGLKDSYSLTNLNADQIKLFVDRKYIDGSVQAKLEALIRIKSDISAVEANISALNGETARIQADQKRIRDNVEALAKTTEAKTLIDRYIAKEGEQESRLEAIEKERKELIVKSESLNQQFAAAVKGFELN